MKTALAALVVMAVAMLIWAAETAWDHRRPDRKETLFIAGIVVCLAIVGFLIFLHFGRFE